MIFYYPSSIKTLTLLVQNIDWDALIKAVEISEVKTITINSRYRPLIFFMRNDNTFYEYRPPVNLLPRFANEWNSFRQLNDEVKREIVNAISESEQHSMSMLRFRDQNFEEYINEIAEKQLTTATTISQKTLNEQAENDTSSEDEEYTSRTNDRT